MSRTARLGEMVEQIGYRVIGTVRGDEISTLKRCLPIALVAGDKDDAAGLVARVLKFGR